MQATSRKRLSLVQSARGIAIMFVLLGHVNILFFQQFSYDWFRIGQWIRTGGVDFFFIVSGFMIYYVYYRNVGVPGKAREFLIKRMIRILPLYWLFTLLSIMSFFIIPTLGEGHERQVKTMITSLLLLTSEPILASAWSLSFIVLFYMMFSLYMFRPKIFLPFLIGWGVVSLLIGNHLVAIDESLLFNFSNVEIIFGCLLAYLVLHYRLKYSTLAFVAGLLGYVAIWTNNIFQFFSIYEPYYYFIFALMMMYGITVKDMTKDITLPKSLSLLGDASYSIYIAHGPFLHFYLFIVKRFSIVNVFGLFFAMCFVIVLSVISCYVVYITIEKPMTNKLREILIKKPLRPLNTVVSKL